MAKLIIVVGLPGSGKSCYLKELKAKEEVKWICEDFHAGAYGDLEHVVCSRYFGQLIENLKNNVDCAVADIAFCEKHRIESFIKVVEDILPEDKQPEKDIRYFQNEPELCVINVEKRANERIEKTKVSIDRYKDNYAIPDDAVVLKVYDGNLDT